nr:probable transposase [Mesorhizobium loti NZP2037]
MRTVNLDAGEAKLPRAQPSRGTVKLARGGDLWLGLGYERDVQSLPGLPLSGRDHNQAVWLYHCSSLSPRDVELILAGRVVVSYETIREWSLRFGCAYAKLRNSPSDQSTSAKSGPMPLMSSNTAAEAGVAASRVSTVIWCRET